MEEKKEVKKEEEKESTKIYTLEELFEDEKGICVNKNGEIVCYFDFI